MGVVFPLIIFLMLASERPNVAIVTFVSASGLVFVQARWPNIIVSTPKVYKPQLLTTTLQKLPQFLRILRK